VASEKDSGNGKEKERQLLRRQRQIEEKKIVVHSNKGKLGNGFQHWSIDWELISIGYQP